MKKKSIPVGQYAFETINIDGAPEEFLQKTAPLIGYIVHSFNTLEQVLNTAICQLINDRSDIPGLVVIHKLNYSAKVDLFKRFVNMQKTFIKDRFLGIDKLISRLNDIGSLRNQVVHADWESAFNNGYTRCKLKINSDGVQYDYIQFSPESLEKIKQLIDETNILFDEILDE